MTDIAAPRARPIVSAGAYAVLGRGAISALTGVALALLFLVSAMVLTSRGIAYASSGGGILDKLHPGTWLVFLTFALACVGGGDPIGFLDGVVRRSPGLLAFFLTICVVVAHLVFVQKSPFTALLETFVMPMALMVLVERMGPRAKARTEMMLHAVFAANAALGLYEFLNGFRLTPYYAGELLIEDDWRSTALLGHPLGNAILTGSYVTALCAGAGRAWPGMAKAAAIGLQLAAMIAFGGRSSLVVLLIFVLAAGGRGAWRLLRGGRVSVPQAALLVAALPAALAGLALLAQSGFFALLAQRFVDDNGSAQARLIMLKLFTLIPIADLMLGPDQEWLQSLQRLEGAEYGLESFWLATILSYGAIIAGVFFAGLFAFLRELMRAARPGAGQVLLYFFINASSSVSLSAKTQTFGLVVALVLILLRRAPLAAASGDAGTSARSLSFAASRR